MSQVFLIILVSLIFFLVFIFFFKKIDLINNFFLDLEFNKPQSFHNEPTPRFGGVMIFLALVLNLLFFSEFSDLIQMFLILGLLNFLVGLIDDLKIIRKPIFKFIMLIFLNLSAIYIYNIKILNFDIFIFDYLNQIYIFSFILTLMAIFFIINGSNLIDGFNGLLVIHTIIIMSFMLILVFENVNFNNDIENYTFILILTLSIFLLFNFPFAKVFLGDSGAYLIGSQLAILTIKLSEILNNVSPIFFAILLHYLFFEIFFSVFRKIFQNKNPFYPDNEHLHMLIFKFFNKRISNDKIANPITSFIINSYFLITILFAFMLRENSLNCLIYFIFLFFLYIILYLFFRKKI